MLMAFFDCKGMIYQHICPPKTTIISCRFSRNSCRTFNKSGQKLWVSRCSITTMLGHIQSILFKIGLSATTMTWWRILPAVRISTLATCGCFQPLNADCGDDPSNWTQVCCKKCSRSSVTFCQKNSVKGSRKNKSGVWQSALWRMVGILKRILRKGWLPSLRMSLLYLIPNKCNFVKFFLSFFQ